MGGLIVLAVWAVSGFLAYGLMLGYLTNLFPEFDNSRPALTFLGLQRSPCWGEGGSVTTLGSSDPSSAKQRALRPTASVAVTRRTRV